MKKKKEKRMYAFYSFNSNKDIVWINNLPYPSSSFICLVFIVSLDFMKATHSVTALDHWTCVSSLQDIHTAMKFLLTYFSEHIPTIKQWMAEFGDCTYLCYDGLWLLFLPTHIWQKVYIFFGNKFWNTWDISKRNLITVLYRITIGLNFLKI